jgi:hypothetical protein
MAGNSVERVGTGMTVFEQQLATAHLAQMAVMALQAEITQNQVCVAGNHPRPGR